MQLTFHGAAGVVTGSCFLLQTQNNRFLIDCGLFQGSKPLQRRNYEPFPFDPSSIDAVFLTHAHIDHSGLLPKLVRQGFRGPIYATGPTADLLGIMLPDSAHIQETEVERLNRRRARRGEKPLTPIYTTADAHTACERVRPVEIGREFSPAPGVWVGFWPAGHILGAASITVKSRESGSDRPTCIGFSGDLGGEEQPLIDEAETVPGADIVVMESTYGNRRRIRDDDRYDKLGDIIRATFGRGGNVIIPSFAVGRAQEVIYGLHRLIHAGEIGRGQIYLDSPLAVEATEIFSSHVQSFDEEARRFARATSGSPLAMEQLTMTRSVEESMAINRIRSGAVVISASGMCEAGRIKHHLRHNLWRPECSVVFVGYQAEGTLGRRIQRGEETVRIHGEPVRVRAEIHTLEGFSAHAGQQELVDWAARLDPAPEVVYLVHGEEDARKTLGERLQTELGLTCAMPLLDETVEVKAGRVARRAEGRAIGSASTLESLWQKVEHLRTTVDRLEREGAPPDVLEPLAEAVDRAIAKALQAVRDGGKLAG